MYAHSPDPWGFRTRWYERRKRALTLAALPRPSYRLALDVGASIGVLTAELARRCDRLVAVEGDPEAVAALRGAVPANVDVVPGWVPAAFPPGRYDLVVLSEVGYYLDPPTWSQVLDLVGRSVEDDAVVLACHWRHPVDGYPQDGDQVHAALAARWPRLSRLAEEDVLLEVFAPGGTVSVARDEGLV
jgi:SAM-dependent methyltransferase